MGWNELVVFIIMQTALLITHRKITRLYLQNTIITITFQFSFSHLATCFWLLCTSCQFAAIYIDVTRCPNSARVLQVTGCKSPLVFPEAHCEDSLTSFTANLHSYLSRHAAWLGAVLRPTDWMPKSH